MAANNGMPQQLQQEQEAPATEEARQDLPRPYKCPVSTSRAKPVLVMIQSANIFSLLAMRKVSLCRNM